MKTIKYFLSCITVMLLVMFMCGTVYAADPDDITENTGSISITLSDTDEHDPVSGAEVALYHVAEVGFNDGGYSFSYVPEYRNCGVVITEVEDPDAAEELYLYSVSHFIKSDIKFSNENGYVEFSGLGHGLYLVAEPISETGFTTFSPFLVCIPYTDPDGTEWLYNVNATPKILIEKEPVPHPPPSTVFTTTAETTAEETTTEEETKVTTVITDYPNYTTPYVWTGTNPPEEPEESPVPYGEDMNAGAAGDRYGEDMNAGVLMQTGQLNWPIPILASLGALLITVGIIVIFIGRKHFDEK